MGLIRQGIFPTQVMAHHKAYVKEKALNNKLVTHDTFVFPSDERNLVNKRIDELWQKHPTIPLMSKCGFWKALIQCFIMSNMPQVGPKFIKLG